MYRKIICLLLCIPFLLSGCAPLVMDLEDLMQAPNLSTEQSEIYNALGTFLNTEQIKLKYPRYGEYRSAFVMQDLDRDGTEEAIVLYEQVIGSQNYARINVLDYDENGWHSVYDTPGLGADIEFIAFAHITESDKKDVIIGWGNGNMSATSMSVYTYSESRLNKIFEDTYELFNLIERPTGMEEIIIISSVNRDPSARLIRKRTPTKLGVSSIAKLNTNIKEYSKVTLGKVSEEDNALFIDEVLQDGSTATEVIFVHNTLLVNAMMDTEMMSNDFFYETIRNEKVYCQDVNQDGIIEVPTQKMLPGYGVEDEMENMYLTTYNIFAKKELVPQMQTVVNQKDGYQIIFPPEWVDKVTVKVQPHTGEYSFVVYTDGLANSTTELLRIRVYARQDYRDKFELEQYRLLASKGNFEYYAYIPEGITLELAVKYEHLEKMFQLLSF